MVIPLKRGTVFPESALALKRRSRRLNEGELSDTSTVGRAFSPGKPRINPLAPVSDPSESRIRERIREA